MSDELKDALDKARYLLDEALWKIDSPSKNHNGGWICLGGIYWRVIAAANCIQPFLEQIEGNKHAAMLIDVHKLKVKDALTYAHDAGFFSFNVIGWKAEFERLIEAVRADAIADHIRDATKISQVPVGYVDSTPHLHIGHSSFEDWYQAHSKASGGDKQLARDAYAAGMGDPLVSSVEPAKQEPAEYLMEVTCTKCGATESGVLKFKEPTPVKQEPVATDMERAAAYLEGYTDERRDSKDKSK